MQQLGYAIIAAGLGSRLQQEGILQPKPMIVINGKPMIGRLIEQFADNGAGCVDVIVNTSNTQTRDYLMNTDFGIDVNLVVKDTPSSMHSLYELAKTGICRNVDRVVVTTVDTVFDPADFKKYINACRCSNANALMGITPFVDDEKPLFVDVDNQNVIQGYYDQKCSCSHVSAGIYGLDSQSFNVLERTVTQGMSRMRNFQRALIDNGLDVQAFRFGKVIDVDHATDIEVAQRFLL
ncbi:MAG: NTP transferase domain-containing protein [Bacteroidaceae bacterium]|nr:NTP transferase domain-containing protein [Bacteroidaceae bacterium]